MGFEWIRRTCFVEATHAPVHLLLVYYTMCNKHSQYRAISLSLSVSRSLSCARVVMRRMCCVCLFMCVTVCSALYGVDQNRP